MHVQDNLATSTENGSFPVSRSQLGPPRPYATRITATPLKGVLRSVYRKIRKIPLTLGSYLFTYQVHLGHCLLPLALVSRTVGFSRGFHKGDFTSLKKY